MLGTLLLCGFGETSLVCAQTTNYGTLKVNSGTIVSTLFDFENKEEGEMTNDGEFYVFANYANKGKVGFTEGQTTGLTRFQGSALQIIQGAREINLQHVLFQNAAQNEPFHLSGLMNISGEADFSDGIVQANEFDGEIDFKENGLTKNVSDASFVDGLVSKSGDKAFTYPIGDKGYYRLDAISATGNNGDFRTQYFFEDPNSQYPRANKEAQINAINDAEYWTMEKREGAKDVKLSLSFRDVTTPAFILGEVETGMHIVRWDETAQQWEDLGGEMDAANQLITTPEELSAYGVFTMATVQSSLTDLTITKTSFEKMVWAGDDLEYEIRVQNNSDITATNVVIVDNLPDGTRYKSMTVESAFGLLEYTLETMGQSLIWTVPEFISRDEMIIKLTVSTQEVGAIKNLVQVSSKEEDAEPSDNIDEDENEVREFFIPNIITPNADGENDVFEIKGLSKFSQHKVTIINRWGDHVFESDDYKNNWDADGLIDGTYFYVLEVTLDDGSRKTFKGWIQVMRNPIK